MLRSLVGSEMCIRDRYMEQTVKISVEEYLKGCGDNQISVSGFLDGAACGSGTAELNDKLIIFACKDDAENNTLQKWKLNNIAIHTGAIFIKHDSNALEDVKKIVNDNPTENSCTNQKCGEFKSNNQLIFLDIFICILMFLFNKN